MIGIRARGIYNRYRDAAGTIMVRPCRTSAFDGRVVTVVPCARARRPVGFGWVFIIFIFFSVSLFHCKTGLGPVKVPVWSVWGTVWRGAGGGDGGNGSFFFVRSFERCALQRRGTAYIYIYVYNRIARVV